MQGIASVLASKGRGEDSMLVHMTPKEVASLQGLASLHGGSLTINPHTGLPEAGFLSSILPMVAGAATTAMGMGPIGSALVGAGTGFVASGGRLSGAISGGLGGYGGSSLMSGFMGAAPEVAAGTMEGAGNTVFGAAPDAFTNSAMLQAMQSGGGQAAIDAAAAAQASQAANATLTGMQSGLGTAANTTLSGMQSGLGSAATEAQIAAARALPQTGMLDPAASAATATVNPIAPTTNSISTGVKSVWNSLTDPSTVDKFYKDGKVTPLGYGALGLGAYGLNQSATAAANKNAWTRFNNGPYGQGGYQGAMARAHYAAGGITGQLPDPTQHQQHEMVPGIDPSVDPYSGQLQPAPQPQAQLPQMPQQMAGGGVAGQPRFLKGPGDGMSDSIPAHIAGKQPAALANEEFVIPADVVSHLGNGSSESGAKQLYAMMDRIRKARTGHTKQGKQITPQKLMAA